MKHKLLNIFLAAMLIAALVAFGLPVGTKPVQAAAPKCSDVVITDAKNLKASDTIALFGAHEKTGIGYKFAITTAGTVTATLHPEDTLIILLDRKDPLQNILPLGINNISGRSGHGPARDQVLSLQQVLDAFNKVSGSEEVRLDQIIGVVVVPIQNCKKGLNWDWSEAAHELLRFTPGGDKVIENFATGNVDGINPLNVTTVWAHFGASSAAPSMPAPFGFTFPISPTAGVTSTVTMPCSIDYSLGPLGTWLFTMSCSTP